MTIDKNERIYMLSLLAINFFYDIFIHGKKEITLEFPTEDDAKVFFGEAKQIMELFQSEYPEVYPGKKKP